MRVRCGISDQIEKGTTTDGHDKGLTADSVLVNGGLHVFGKPTRRSYWPLRQPARAAGRQPGELAVVIAKCTYASGQVWIGAHHVSVDDDKDLVRAALRYAEGVHEDWVARFEGIGGEVNGVFLGYGEALMQ